MRYLANNKENALVVSDEKLFRSLSLTTQHTVEFGAFASVILLSYKLKLLAACDAQRFPFLTYWSTR